jgi:tetratricopeptide (TPR) repeat protein
VLGYFTPNGKSLNFYHEYSEPEQTTWVALHECTHLLTYLVDPEYEPQIWVNEGVADFFGSSKVYRGKNGKLVIEPGQLQTDRILTVQQALKDEKAAGPATAGAKVTGFAGRPFTKLEDLFMLTHDEFDGFQYAHAWSFVYFLNTAQNGKYAKSFGKFFKGLYTTEKGIPVKTDDGWKRVDPKDIRDYLLAKLGVKDVPALEAEWKAFVAAIPIDGVPAKLKRGLISVRRGDFESALDDLDAAIAGGATDPRAWYARGKAELFLGKRDQAIADAQKAVEMDPLAANYRYGLSLMMVGIATTGGPGGVSFKADDGVKLKDDDAKAQAGLAMELDPENERFREWFESFE